MDPKLGPAPCSCCLKGVMDPRKIPAAPPPREAVRVWEDPCGEGSERESPESWTWGARMEYILYMYG